MARYQPADEPGPGRCRMNSTERGSGIMSMTRRTQMPLVARLLLVAFIAQIGGNAGAQWEQLRKFVADDGMAGDYFGRCAIDGNAIVIGTAWDGNDPKHPGAAYVFDAINGLQLLKLTPDDGEVGDRFGTSVAIDGDIIVVGAPWHSDTAGAAYVFDADTGQQLHKLVAEDAGHFELLGLSVAISGNIIVVGAPNADGAENGSGAAYIFSAITGQQLLKLAADDGEMEDLFGYSVAMEDFIVVIGAQYDDDNGEHAGAVYVFDTSRGRQLHKLLADDGDSGDIFGASVSMFHDTIVIGASSADGINRWEGAAYLFDAVSGHQLDKLLPDDPAEEDHFGTDVSINERTVVIGSVGDDDHGDKSGSAYVFDADTGQQIQKLTADDAAAGDSFGMSVANDGGRILIGATHDDDLGENSGSAYLFHQPQPCPADLNDDYLVDIEDLFIVLGFWGDGDVPADVNQDGVVDINDIFELLGAWGPCP